MRIIIYSILTLINLFSMNVKSRLLEFVAYTQMSKRKFQEKIGVSNSYIQNISESIGADIMNRISIQYPELNITWLLTGEGEMLKKTVESNIASSLDKKETRPRIPYDAAAGTLTEAVEGVTEYQCEQLPVISAFPKYDFTIRITGKSMEPEYFAGDEVACLRVNEKQFLQWGRVHVLDTTQGVVIKRIYDAGESILCRSYNPEFPDFSIPKENIRSYNLVVGSLRL